MNTDPLACDGLASATLGNLAWTRVVTSISSAASRTQASLEDSHLAGRQHPCVRSSQWRTGSIEVAKAARRRDSQHRADPIRSDPATAKTAGQAPQMGVDIPVYLRAVEKRSWIAVVGTASSGPSSNRGTKCLARNNLKKKIPHPEIADVFPGRGHAEGGQSVPGQPPAGERDTVP